MPTFNHDKSVKNTDAYVTKIEKMVPIEVTGLFIFFSTLLEASRDKFDALSNHLLAVFLFCLVVIIGFMFFHYLPKLQNVVSQTHRLIICISFLIWIWNTENELLLDVLEYWEINTDYYAYFESVPAAMILGLWTFVIPAFINPVENSEV